MTYKGSEDLSCQISTKVPSLQKKLPIVTNADNVNELSDMC